MYTSRTIVAHNMNMQSPLHVPYLVGAEYPIEDGHPYPEVHEEELVGGEIEEVTAHAINRLLGGESFEDAPEPIEVQGHLVSGCSRFGCRVPGDFAEVVLCANPICNIMMGVEC